MTYSAYNLLGGRKIIKWLIIPITDGYLRLSKHKLYSGYQEYILIDCPNILWRQNLYRQHERVYNILKYFVRQEFTEYYDGLVG
jgi:hypothetical protein